MTLGAGVWNGGMNCSGSEEGRSEWAGMGGEHLLGKWYQNGVLEKGNLQRERREEVGILEDNDKG